MEMKNTIETKIEREHFEQVFTDLLVDKLDYKVKGKSDSKYFADKAKRDYELMKDFLGIDAPELDEKELSNKYALSETRVKQIVRRWARHYTLNCVGARENYLQGVDYTPQHIGYRKEEGFKGFELKGEKN